jgi:hypothetical protein
MALIIEDGTGVVNANSYVTEEEATAFLELRGRDDWPADEAEQRKFLVRAADYLNTFYGWGLPMRDDQTMAIPTLSLDYVPQQVKTAQVLLAYEASKGELADSAIAGPSVTKERKKLDGVGEKEFEYADDAPLGGRRFPAVDALLAGIVVSSAGSSIQVARRLR